MARVGDYEISALEFDGMQPQFQAAYERSAGRPLEPAERPIFRRTVLEQLIRQRLLRAEARRRGFAGSDADAERLMREAGPFRTAAGIDEAAWAAFRANPGAFRPALAEAKEILGSQRLFERMRAQLTPSDARIAALVAERNQSAEVRVLPVGTTWFEPGIEMRADSLRAHYRAIQSRFATPARARVGLVVVPFPDAQAGPSPPEAVRAATRARAESLLVAIRAGTPFDSAAAQLGGERQAGWWSAGQTAGVFFDDPELGEQAVRGAPGQVLERPLRVPAGYALVRVSELEPARLTPLAQVADSVARDYRRRQGERQAATRMEAARLAHPDAFRTACTEWHAALVDTGGMSVKNPSTSTLRDWYKKNASQFAQLDAHGHGLAQAPFEQVREAVRVRYLTEQRWQRAGEVAERIARAWGRGRRDNGAEKLARVWRGTRSVTEDDPPAGVPPAAFDSARQAPVGRAATFADSLGYVVFAVAGRDSGCALPEGLARRRTAEILARDRAAREEDEARAFYEAHRERYYTEPTYHVTYLQIEPRSFLVTDIPRSEVERYYHQHPDQFGEPAEVRVRHLLVLAPPRADTADGYAKAIRLLAAARAGADFDSLVRADSQDPGTRDQGGDTGWFRRGMTAPAFETAAFALAPGELGGPVRTEFGYHLIQGVESKEEKLSPLSLVYGIAAQKTAAAWADSLAAAFADSVARLARRAADLERHGRQRSYQVVQIAWLPGTRPLGPTHSAEMQRDLQAMPKPGMLRRVYRMPSVYFVAHLDSISAPTPASWELARDRALADSRAARLGAYAEHALEAVRGELAAGVPWDSAAAPWGGGLGFAHRRGTPLPGIPDTAVVDSLLYGPPARRLADGQAAVLSGEHGATLVVLSQHLDSAIQLAPEEREALRQAILERAFYDYFETLKRRHPVRILRADLRTELPVPPAP